MDVTVHVTVSYLPNREGTASFVQLKPQAFLLNGADVVSADDEAVALLATFRKERTYTPGSSPEMEVPEALKAQLAALVPAGYRLETGKDGIPRMVKMRNRKPSVKRTGEQSKAPETVQLLD